MYSFDRKEMVIYLDLDDVLVDFDTVTRAMVPNYAKMEDYYFKGINKEAFDEVHSVMVNMIENTPQFWENLPWTHDGKLLFDFVKTNFCADKICIISSLLAGNEEKCLSGKKYWVNKNLGIKKDNVFFSSNKGEYVNKISGKGQILIDDRNSNLDNWAYNKGYPVKHYSSVNTINQLKKLIK